MRNRTRIVCLLSLLVFTLTTACLSACNTVKGVGRDLERAGEKIQGAAD